MFCRELFLIRSEIKNATALEVKKKATAILKQRLAESGAIQSFLVLYNKPLNRASRQINHLLDSLPERKGISVLSLGEGGISQEEFSSDALNANLGNYWIFLVMYSHTT